MDFSKAKFQGVTFFPKAQFHGDANFEKAQFRTAVFFNEAKFQGDAWFSEAAFYGAASFHEVSFGGSAQFGGSTNPKDEEAKGFDFTSFYGTKFSSEANFSNRIFHDHTDFDKCHFGRAPNFHESKLHQDTAFGAIDCFPDLESPGAERAYRTLRYAMEGHRARSEEGMFYTLEQCARHRKMGRFRRIFSVSFVYEWGSNYGYSIARPLAWFLGGIALSSLLLLVIGVLASPANGVFMAGLDAHRTLGPLAIWGEVIRAPGWLLDKIGETLLFSVRQTFLPFDALRANADDLTKYVFNPWGTWFLLVWGTLLTLFEGLAALLLILAVRWRYRR